MCKIYIWNQDKWLLKTGGLYHRGSCCKHVCDGEEWGSIGILKGTGENETFHPRGNFPLKIVAKVEGAKDGYMLHV